MLISAFLAILWGVATFTRMGVVWSTSDPGFRVLGLWWGELHYRHRMASDIPLWEQEERELYRVVCKPTILRVTDWRMLGLSLPDGHYSVDHPLQHGSVWSLKLPLWVPFLATALPTLLLYRVARRRRLFGHCPSCKYDLTGNTSGTCPECGKVIPERVKVWLRRQATVAPGETSRSVGHENQVP